MGIRDEASLSAKERAALAGLEARAVADDPRWAASLAGQRARRLPTLSVPQWVPDLLEARWVGPVLVAVGLVLMMLSLSVSLVLGVVAAALVALGLGSAAHAWTRWARGRASAAVADTEVD